MTTDHLPTDLAAVALIDAKTAAAGGAMSISWWHQKVASGEAPQPAIRAPRCTRWRLSEVSAFWRDFAERGDDPQTRAKLLGNATKASSAAAAKRGRNQQGA